MHRMPKMTDSHKGLVVGAISSHGHERGHVLVLHQLAEIEAIHVCAATELVNVDDLAAESTKVVSKTTAVSDLLQRADLDAVTVCARPDHAPAILEQVVAAGLPVLYDKPAATHSAQLRKVADLARAKRVSVGAMLQWRYHPMVQTLKRALADQALGDIMTIEAKLLNGLLRYRDTTNYLFDPKTAGSGILSWLGCHCLDLVLYLMEERVVEVMAMLGNLNPEAVPVEDTGFLILKFASGRLGSFQAGYHLRGSKSVYDFYVGMRGSLGYASLPLIEPCEPHSRNAAIAGGVFTLYSEARHWVTGRTRHEQYEIPETPGYGGIMAEELFRDFFAAVQTGAPAPAPIEDSVHMLEIIEAAKESSATGRAVRIGNSL
jgi:predicted dehydrogenase